MNKDNALKEFELYSNAENAKIMHGITFGPNEGRAIRETELLY